MHGKKHEEEYGIKTLVSPIHRGSCTVSRRTAGLPEPWPADRHPGGRADHHPEGRYLHFAPPPVRLRRASGYRDDRRFIPIPTLRFRSRSNLDSINYGLFSLHCGQSPVPQRPIFRSNRSVAACSSLSGARRLNSWPSNVGSRRLAVDAWRAGILNYPTKLTKKPALLVRQKRRRRAMNITLQNPTMRKRLPTPLTPRKFP